VPAGSELERGASVPGVILRTLCTLRGLYNVLVSRARTERGASMVEYALLIGMIAVVSVVIITAFGATIGGEFSKTNACVTGMTTGC
jgi:Flp pilus assembly pilin Flp